MSSLELLCESVWVLGQFRIMPEIDATNWFTWHESTSRDVRGLVVPSWGVGLGVFGGGHCCNLTTLISVFLSFSLANFGAFSH